MDLVGAEAVWFRIMGRQRVRNLKDEDNEMAMMGLGWI